MDLRPEGISAVYDLIGNLVIARDTIIEYYVAGLGDDVIMGNVASNTLESRHGADTLHGLACDDTARRRDDSAGCWGFFSLTKRSRWWRQTITIFSETVKQIIDKWPILGDDEHSVQKTLLIYKAQIF